MILTHMALVCSKIIRFGGYITKQKFTLLNSGQLFVPVAIKMSSVFEPEAISFIKELGQRIRAKSRGLWLLQFLLQGFAVSNVAMLQQ